uniref:hypothetical protein n=1 Tax=Romboutsia timonensis TaxID=1776391 RepID=UPI00248C8B99
MNQKILKRLDNAISSTLIGKSKDPDCNVGAAISVIHKGQEVFRNEEYVGKHTTNVDNYVGKAFYPSKLYPGR